MLRRHVTARGRSHAWKVRLTTVTHVNNAPCGGECSVQVARACGGDATNLRQLVIHREPSRGVKTNMADQRPSCAQRVHAVDITGAWPQWVAALAEQWRRFKTALTRFPFWRLAQSCCGDAQTQTVTASTYIAAPVRTEQTVTPSTALRYSPVRSFTSHASPLPSPLLLIWLGSGERTSLRDIEPMDDDDDDDGTEPTDEALPKPCDDGAE